jgi:hypothetical protein
MSEQFRVDAPSTLTRLVCRLQSYRRHCIIYFTTKNMADQLETQDCLSNANDRFFFPRDLEVLKTFLSHGPFSFNFERSYKSANFDLDISAITLEEQHQTTHVSDVAPVVLLRAEIRMTEQQESAFIDTYISRYAAPDAPDPQLERRRFERAVLRELRREIQDLKHRIFTKMELDARVAELQESSALIKKIRARITAKSHEMSGVTRDQSVQDAAMVQEDELDDDDDDEEVEQLMPQMAHFESELGIQMGENDEYPDSLFVPQSPKTINLQAGPIAQNTTASATALVSAPEPAKPYDSTTNFVANMETVSSWLTDQTQPFRAFDRKSQDTWIEFLEGYRNETSSPLMAVSQTAIDWNGQLPRLLRALRQQLQVEVDPDRIHPDFLFSIDLPGDNDHVIEIPYDQMVSTFLEMMHEGSGMLALGAQ